MYYSIPRYLPEEDPCFIRQAPGLLDASRASHILRQKMIPKREDKDSAFMRQIIDQAIHMTNSMKKKKNQIP
jgi:hypothetical protein